MKKLIFSLILLTMCYAVIEVFALTAYYAKFGEYKLYDLQTGKLDTIAKLTEGGVYTPEDDAEKGNTERPQLKRKQIIHPYIGYTLDGKILEEGCISEDQQDCYKRIKVPTDKKFPKRSADKLIIAMMGGSFANGTAHIGKQMISATLSGSGLFTDREIILFDMGAGGFKQPQQLMNLAYHYALGAEFDLVINLDGFNEIAAGYLGYRDYGLHPAFPVHWHNRVNSALTQEFLDLYSNKKSLMEKHAAYAKFWLVEGIRYSPLMNFIWRFVDVDFQSKLAKLEEVTTTNGSGKKTNRDFAYEALGPDYHFEDWGSFIGDVAQIWVNSSLALRAMSEGQGAKYYHFLQPNQYIPGNKIMSDFEKKHTVLEYGSYGNVYQKWHPVVVEKSQQLVEKQVNYYDMTYTFKDNSQTLYVDNCCHMNNKGYDLVAKHISETIIKQMRSEK